MMTEHVVLESFGRSTLTMGLHVEAVFLGLVVYAVHAQPSVLPLGHSVTGHTTENHPDLNTSLSFLGSHGLWPALCT